MCGKKLAFSVIAARLKPHFEHIISLSQSGFLKGRHMGECKRLVYDIMYHTENKNIPCLLMLIDFEKAFEPVLWQFIHKTLNYFGFNEKFISWIQLFNTNVNAFCLIQLQYKEDVGKVILQHLIYFEL